MVIQITNGQTPSIKTVKQEFRYKRDLGRAELQHLKRSTGNEKQLYRRYGRNIKDILYDFHKKEFIYINSHSDTIANPPYEIHEMDGIGIKIININPFVYTVDLIELQGDQISNEKLLEAARTNSLQFQTTQFKELALNSILITNGDKDDSDSVTLIKNELNLKAARGVAKTITDLSNLKKENDSEIQIMQFKIKNKVDPLTQDSIQEVQLRILGFDLDRKKEVKTDLDERIAQQKKYFADLKIDTLAAISDIETTKLKIRSKPTQKSLLTKKMLTDSIQKIRANVIKINRYVFLHNQILNNLKTSSNNFDTVSIEIKKVLESVGFSNAMEIPIAYFKSQQAISDVCDHIYIMLEDLVKLDSQRTLDYRLAQKDIISFMEVFRSFDHNQLIAQISGMLALIRRENFEVDYQTLSIAENADFIRYRIQVKPVSNPLPNSTGPFNLDISFYINEGLKLDVSTAMLLDFNLADPKFYFEKFSTSQTGQTFDSVRVKKSPNTGNITPSIALMLNAYKRSSLNFKGGGSLGFGLSSDLRFRLYAGPSLIIGRKERITLSSGVAFGALLRNADGFNEGTVLADNPSLPTSVPMVQDAFDFGWYFGIGFNLTGKDTKGFMEKVKFN
ncbi:MAG TPA: hypothetical protein DHV26_03105 [Cytophagales bacterium]|nr:hypothetical protein [Cytophagales bacterium]